MIMIFEGQARTGKSSTIQRVADILNAEGIPTLIRKSYKREDYFGYLLQDVLPMAQDQEKLYLLDRCHISDMVYRTMDRTTSLEHYRDMVAFDRVLAKIGALQVYMTAPEEELVLRHLMTVRAFEGDIAVIREIFDTAIGDSLIPTIEIDTSEFNDADDLAESLATFFMINGVGGA